MQNSQWTHHLSQKCWVSRWHRFQRRISEIGVEDGGSGRASNGRPIRKWPGVRVSNPSSSELSGISGQLLRQASIWERTVLNSSKFKRASPSIFFMWDLTLLTFDSHNPPKCGACSGIKDHSIPWEEQKLRILSLDVCSLRNANNSFNSRAAPTKLDPWSLQILTGLPYGVRWNDADRQ